MMNDPRAIVRLFELQNADAINGTPSRYLQYFEYPPFAEAPAKCSLIMAGGEVFPKSLLEKLQSISHAKIINTYSPTEITISANMADLTHADKISVGHPLLNLPELTQKSFVEYNVERVYRSGDYAKWDEAGNVIILGRKDHQVKLRGLRIELYGDRGVYRETAGHKESCSSH